MDGSADQDRSAIVAMLDRALRDAERADAPPAAEQGEWLHGRGGFTAPDEHGWIAPVPQADVWVPRALVFWRMAMMTGASPSEEQRRDPCHLLARWPAIEAAVGRVIAAKNLKACRAALPASHSFSASRLRRVRSPAARLARTNARLSPRS